MSLGEGVLNIEQLSKSLSTRSFLIILSGSNMLEHVSIDECLLLADELKLLLSQPVLSFINPPQIKLVLKKTMDIVEDGYTFDKLASAVRTYKSANTKLSLTPVLRILQNKLNLIGFASLKQMHLHKMSLDLFRCLVDVNTYLEKRCNFTDLLLKKMGLRI